MALLGSDAPVMVAAGAFTIFASYKDEVDLATLLVLALRMLLEVVPVLDLVHLRIL